MAGKSRPSPAKKELLAIVSELKSKISQLETQMDQLQKRNNELEDQLAKARKNSKNSSRRPSGDITKPPKTPPPPGGEGKRKRGAQPGHPKHERQPFSPDEIDHEEDYSLEDCPFCGGTPEEDPNQSSRIIDQVEIVVEKVEVERHRCPGYWCPRCKKFIFAPFPQEVKKAGLTGPQLTALIGYLKGVCHASFSTIRKYLRDVVGFEISRGQLRNIIGKVADSLEQPWLELLESLPKEAVLNVDETGHKDNGNLFWTWCFKAKDFTCFKISESRGSKVLLDILGQDFEGILGCDYFSAYRKYMKDCGVLLQFCLAHLIRDLKFLTSHPDKLTKAYGKKVLEAVREMFALIHRRQEMEEEAFQARMSIHRENILKVATEDVPDRCHVKPIAKRFLENGDGYFRFITTPGVEPTNNLAEQAIRFVVIDRHITQGTRSEAGRKWCERIWTVIATCAHQGRSAFDFILKAVQAHFSGQPAPSLLNSS